MRLFRVSHSECSAGSLVIAAPCLWQASDESNREPARLCEILSTSATSESTTVALRIRMWAGSWDGPGLGRGGACRSGDLNPQPSDSKPPNSTQDYPRNSPISPGGKPDRGERDQSLPQSTPNSTQGLQGQLCAHVCTGDPELRKVIEAWPRLSEDERRRVLEIIGAP